MEGIVPWKLDASIFERNRGISGTDELPFDHAVSSERMITAGFHAGVPLGSGPRVKITAGVKRTDTLYNNEEYIPARDRSIVDSRNFEAEMEGKPDNALKLDIGAVWMLEELSGENLLCPESEIGMHSRESRSIFSGFEWKQSENTGLGITGAARADAVDASFYSGFSIDSFESFRPYNGIDIRLVAGWGPAYRLPTFNELFWIQDVFAEGNPESEPDGAEAINASITVSETAEREIRCRLSAHSTKYKNLIYWMPTPPAGRWKPHNLASAAIDGIEFRASVDPSVGLGGELSFLIQRTRDLEGSAWEEPNTYGRELIYRPNFSGSGGLEWNGDISEQGLLSVRLNGRYTGTRYATRANTVSLPGYFLMDCSISYGFTLKNGALSAETGLSISNLANRRFEIYQDTTGPGRKWKFYMSLEKKEE
jgi:outer membrane cobalamin receptor